MFRKQGSYNVNSTATGERAPRGKMRCTVHHLDDRQTQHDIPKSALGDVLLEQIFSSLDLKETDYFGLQFTTRDNQWEWLNPIKKIKKQTKTTENLSFTFRVKFYMADPSTLQEELTRYMFFQQVKQDILKGRLPVGFSTSSILSAYIVQAELGDFDPLVHNEGYISEFRFVPNQTEDMEGQVEMHHKTLVGMTPADCEFHFLERAQRLEMYGVDLHFARDTDGEEMTIGVAHSGILIFQNKTRINQFQWAMMRKLGFKRKRFLIYLRATEENEQPSVVGFDLPSYRCSKRLWKTCVQHHTFFRQVRPPPPPKYAGLLTFGSKFRYSGRTLNQTIEHGRESVRYNYGVKRTPSKRFQRRTVGGYTATREMRGKDQTHRLQNQEQTDGVFLDTTKQNGTRDGDFSSPDVMGTPPKVGSESFLADVLAATPQHAADEAKPLQLPGPTEVYDETARQNDIEALMEEYPEDSVTEEGYLVVRLLAVEGKFGFNVKGGADQNMYVFVSRITPGSPADLARPRLHEGDQVIVINKRDVREHTHDQVVTFIRATMTSDPPLLEITVKPAKPVPNLRMAEMNLMRNHAKRKSSVLLPPSARPEEFLKMSIKQLQESLQSDEALTEFDQLYRRKPTMTCHDAFEADNFCRNRYRDIAPYDATRVHLKETTTTDYINASHVKMPVGHTELEYIAAQGPLQHTLNDFWKMVWQQNCNMIVMVTKEVENDHPKCQRYWPQEGETMEFGDIHVKLLVEQDDDKVCTSREMAAINVKTGEERNIKQYQYTSWPDHGEPEDATHFTEFVMNINTLRRPGEPLLVHCSAGIGRTGMFIMMETALMMMRYNEPVYALELLTMMRDQRPMVIQTGRQYNFVCEAIVSAFNEKLYLPVADRIAAKKAGAYNMDSRALSPPDGRKRSTSESSSDSGSSSESSSDSDTNAPRDDAGERVQIRGNPLAMEDD